MALESTEEGTVLKNKETGKEEERLAAPLAASPSRRDGGRREVLAVEGCDAN